MESKCVYYEKVICRRTHVGIFCVFHFFFPQFVVPSTSFFWFSPPFFVVSIYFTGTTRRRISGVLGSRRSKWSKERLLILISTPWKPWVPIPYGRFLRRAWSVTMQGNGWLFPNFYYSANMNKLSNRYDRCLTCFTILRHGSRGRISNRTIFRGCVLWGIPENVM